MDKFEKIVKVLWLLFICLPIAIGLIIAATGGNDGKSNTKHPSSAPYMRNYNNQKRQYELNKQRLNNYPQYQSSQLSLISSGSNNINASYFNNNYYEEEADNQTSFSPDDAYEEGRERGYEQGLEDGNHGKSFEWGYDASNSYYNYYETMYEDGYRSGYEDGYEEGRDEYEDE